MGPAPPSSELPQFARTSRNLTVEWHSTSARAEQQTEAARGGSLGLDNCLQDGARKIAKLVYKWLNYGLW